MNKNYKQPGWFNNLYDLRQALDRWYVRHNGRVPISDYLGLPGLRLFCPFTSVSTGGSSIKDLSGGDHHLGKFGNPQYKQYNDLIMYADMDGTGDYFKFADEADFDLTGDETWMDTDLRGVTWGGWFYYNALPAAATYPMLWGKQDDNAVDERAYMIYHDGDTNDIKGGVSSDGTSGNTVVVTSSIVPAISNWYWISCQFDPSTSIRLRVNDTVDINTTSIPATIDSGAGDVLAGLRTGGPNYLNGRIALLFICGALVPNAQLDNIYGKTRVLFKV